ncbi:hypothetical protein CSKR_203923 [Clonorchis sinensis]|uniref:Uncharacterized protein n=1 Tax=Clonorchis sinensis TaxID=79923 RepID=A0A8T1MDP2_CLOSI|nr:hypothetical protein CSKR_203923 [Clonorchis sinensis]
MMGCIGMVDIGGWIFQGRYFPRCGSARYQPPIPIQQRQHQPCAVPINTSCASAYRMEGDMESEHIVLVSPQPPPVIQWPRPVHRSQLKRTPRKILPGENQNVTHACETHLIPHPCAKHLNSASPVPLTAFYLNSGLVFPPNATFQHIPLGSTQNSVPVLLTPHGPTPTLLLKSDSQQTMSAIT